MNFCALKITKKEILGPKNSKIEKLGLKNSQKLKICTQKFTKMGKLSKFQSSVFYEFGPTVQWVKNLILLALKFSIAYSFSSSFSTPIKILFPLYRNHKKIAGMGQISDQIDRYK